MILAALLLLPWSTGLHEVAMALALGQAAWKLRDAATRKICLDLPWAGPTLVLAGLFGLSGLLPPDRDGPGHAWLLAPLIAVPVLWKDEKNRYLKLLSWPNAEAADARFLQWGLISFALAALVAVGLALTGHGPTGLTSHHLTLAYMLLPPLAAALESRELSPRLRFPVITALVLGILAARSEGAMVAMAATFLAAVLRKPWIGLGCGAVGTLALLPLADPSEQQQRALLWTGGLAVRWPAGEGDWLNRAILAWDQLQPGFWFPYHAHDSSIQLSGVLGPAGLGALLWLVWSLFGQGMQAGLVGVLVGSMTQDVFGDLEVARSVWMWSMVMVMVNPARPPDQIQ